jgi:CheY-like chemotaxis protein
MHKILVIDDDPSVLESIRLILSSNGFEVLEAGNGQAGIELAQRMSPSLIFCDISMRGVDGFLVLESLTKDALTASIPVVFITGLLDQKRIRQRPGAREIKILEKPFTVDAMLEMVKNCSPSNGFNSARVGQKNTDGIHSLGK